MTKETKQKLNDLAKLIGSIIVIFSIVAAILTPFIDSYIDSRIQENHKTADFEIQASLMIDKYINSAEFSIVVDGIIKEYEHRDSKKIKLRTLLASKMNIDEDEVHIELGRMYVQYKMK